MCTCGWMKGQNSVLSVTAIDMHPHMFTINIFNMAKSQLLEEYDDGNEK